MEKLQIFENPTFGKIRTVEEDGKAMFCGKDVAVALGYTDTVNALKLHCREDGVAFHQVIDSMGRTQRAKFVDEGNVYRLITHSKLPAAEKFERWVFDEVLPTIRKHGAYVTDKASLSYLKEKELEARINNSMARRAGTLLKIAEKVTVNEYRNVLYSKAAEIAGGQPLLPLPKVEQPTYTAKEIGDRLGISANMVGRLANKNGLKTPEYGLLAWDKARSAEKQVESWRYYETVIPRLQEYMKIGA